jgi:hypothetical protein
MRSSEEKEGIFGQGMHIGYDWENARIRVTVNFGQISLNKEQAEFLSEQLAELAIKIEMWQ